MSGTGLDDRFRPALCLQIAADTPFENFVDQRTFRILMFGFIPQIVYLLRIGDKVEKLTFVALDKVDEFPAAVADHRHELGAAEDAVTRMFGEDEFSPFRMLARQIGKQ